MAWGLLLVGATMGQGARAVMLGGAFISASAWLASDVLGSSRLLFAFGRDGRLPGWFGALRERTRVPGNAVLAYVGAAALLAVTGTFLELVVLSTLAVVGIYILACAAAIVLQRRDVAQAGPALRLRALPVAATVGLLGMAAMLAAAKLAEIGGLLAVVLASLGLFWCSERLGSHATAKYRSIRTEP